MTWKNLTKVVKTTSDERFKKAFEIAFGRLVSEEKDIDKETLRRIVLSEFKALKHFARNNMVGTLDLVGLGKFKYFKVKSRFMYGKLKNVGDFSVGADKSQGETKQI